MKKKVNKRPFTLRSNKARLFTILGLVVFFLGIIATGFFISYNSVDSLLWAQRASNLSTLMDGICDNTNLYFDDTWTDIDHVARRIESGTYADETSMASTLKTIERERSETDKKLLLFYSSDRSVDSDGVVFVYDDYASATQGYTHSLSMADMTGINGSGKESVLFFSRFQSPLSVDGEEVTYLALKVETPVLDAFFAKIRPNDQSAFYLINNDGIRIYHQEQGASSILSSFNLLEGLKSYAFTNGTSYEGMAGDLAAGKVGTVQMSFNSKAYMLSYAPLSTNNWKLLMSLPSDSVSVGVSAYTKNVLVSFSLTFSAMVVAGAGVISWLVYSNHQKEMAYEREKSLEDLAEKEKQASLAKSAFLSSMSHDIRTPMNGIIGMLNIAEENPGDQKTVSECLASIEKSSNHLLSLINDVLDMSRIEAGKVEMKSEPFNILSVLDSCVSIIKGQLEARDITFTTDTSLLKHPYVKGDKVRLQRIVTNILGNAVKFTPDGKSIRFKACEEDASETKVTYRLEFEDTGIGMSEEFQKKIFDPFSQEERPDFTAYKGTGLGMAITKQYVDAMGGKISLVSQIDKGSFFTVLLPLSLASPDEVLSLHQSLTPIPYLAGKKVLLVEDNEINMQIAQHLLEQTHCMVIAVKNGKEAVESFQKEKEGAISLILMDVMMPVMNGYQATQAIRALKRTDALSVKIVAMTANAFQEDFAKAKEAGMNDRLIKPIDKNLFYQIVTKYALEDKAS